MLNKNIHFPKEIINIIMEYSNIHCHTCIKFLSIGEINIKQGEWYYCSENCYNFI